MDIGVPRKFQDSSIRCGAPAIAGRTVGQIIELIS
jgi:hypothetical protein